MRRRTLAAGALVAAGVAGAFVFARRAPLWEPPGCAVAPAVPPLAGRVTGVVRGADCRPAAGATVRLDAYFRTMGEEDDARSTQILASARDAKGAWKRVDPSSKRRRREEARTTTTDAEGRYAFEDDAGLRETLRSRRIMVWAESGEQVAPKVVLRGEASPLRVPDLVLGPSFSPRVRVRTFAGEPVADAHVEVDLRVEDAQGEDVHRLAHRLGARTDARGEAALPRAPVRPDWEASLHVNPRDMPRFRARDVPLAPLVSGEVVELEMSRGFTIRGHVLLPDGAVGADVLVSARSKDDPDPNDGHSTTTRDDGSFELRGVPTRDAIVRFVCLAPPGPPRPGVIRYVDDHAPARLTQVLSGAEGEVAELGTIELLAALQITGVVLDPSGSPARHAYLFLDEIGHGHPTDEQGRFRIDGVEPGPHSLEATIYESPDAREGALVGKLEGVQAGSSGVVVRVTGGGNLVVRFHPAGDPDAPLSVREPHLFWGPGYGGGGGDGKTTEIRMPVPPGTHPVRVTAEGYRPKALGTVTVLPDRKTVVDVTLERAE